MDEIQKLDLKIELDRIDEECLGYAENRFYESRLRILIGMWEKGEKVSLYRGVKGEISYRQLEIKTGRKQENLKKWHSSEYGEIPADFGYKK